MAILLGGELRRLLLLILLNHWVLCAALDLLTGGALHDVHLAWLAVGVLLRCHARAVVLLVGKELGSTGGGLIEKAVSVHSQII